MISSKKNIPKHPIKQKENFGSDLDGNRGIHMEWFECPNCGTELTDDTVYENRCVECNQLLDFD